MLTTQKINKMSTNEIVAKIAKLTNVSKVELSTLTRDELKVALTNMIDAPEKVELVTSFDDVLFFVYGDDGAEDDVIEAPVMIEEEILTDGQIDESKLMFELHPEEKIVGRPAKYADKKLRKAFRHYARRIADKAGVDWETQGDDYIVNGDLISWEKYVAEHS